MLTDLISRSARGLPDRVSFPSRHLTLLPLSRYRAASTALHHPLSTKAGTMLSRACTQQQSNSSKPSSQNLDALGPRTSQSTFAQFHTKAPVLHPSSARTVNSGFGNPSIPLKRKVATRHGMTDPTHTNQRGRGVLSALHDSVYFDENDFVDDCDIDLDDSPPPVPQPLLNASRPEPPTPTPPNSVRYPVIQTSQIAWSSSPAEHKQTPPGAGLLRRDTQNTVKPFVRPSIESQDAQQSALPRRRNLPWLAGVAKEEAAEESRQPKRQKQASADPVVYPALPAMTPQSKIRNDVAQPWDKTASAVKEELKQHRKQLELEKRLAKEASTAEANQEAAAAGPSKGGAVKSMKSSRAAPARVFLSDEQKRVLNLIDQNKKSVFFTGSAGTGKSVLMREIIHVLKRRFSRDNDRVAVTASTGLAACNIGGVTLHNFSGIGLGKEPVEQLIKKIKKNPKAKNRWMRTKVLVVDEISMVDGGLFDKLEEIARTLRKNGRPFGGIQLVVTGDFFQLPPVPERGQAAKFAFEAATWATSIQHTIGLTQVFRQKDPTFANMLNEMRLGKLSDAAIAKFRSLNRDLTTTDDVEATELFPTRSEVDRANESRMQRIPGAAAEFYALDGGSITDLKRRTDLLQNCMAPEKVVLKIGAQVMLIKNVDETLVNGSIGKVTAFMDETTYDYNRSKGVDEDEMGYDELVGNSRPKLNSIANMTSSTSQKWPLVEFQLPDGTSRELLCVREAWKIEQPNGEVLASRNQVPLILAWALSIHKAQGQTLEKVRVDLGKIFEKGQAYVALSRATTQEGLQVLRFDPRKVMAHDKVRAFYASLSTFGGQMKGSAPAQSAITDHGISVDGTANADGSIFISDDDEVYATAAP